MMKLMERITDLLDDQPLMDVILACASAAAFALKELPPEQREAGRRAAHELIDKMLEEWSHEAP